MQKQYIFMLIRELTRSVERTENKFGLQNLYMGHIKRFMMNLLFIAFSVIMFVAGLVSKGFISTGFISGLIWLCAWMLAVNIYWGLIDFVRILSGHAKDVNGAYLLTNRQ